ncbi:hypothetical protein EJ02DRAFT_202598 [Clathrospora elynae]|uniref:EthD domain-containing protein n=1 Tax=Clathrospora elynae TaxID=706981 RepID=A0A6A5SP63_9PLEO|nr:hypothetical protein EJ02DRAFT_202598 [Clathrospora elynae]
MTSTIQGPGILFVRSRISPASKQVLDEPTFLKWYDDLHIPEVVSTSGIKSAFRYIDMHKTCPASPKPYLAFYPMLDLAFTLSEEFRGVRVESETLPGSGVVYDLADFDVSYLGFCGATMPKRGHGRAEYIVTAGIRPGNDADMESLDKFFEEVIRKLVEGEVMC